MDSLMEMLKAGRKKAEAEQVVEPSYLEPLIYKRIMESPILGEAELIFNLDEPNRATVDGVPYTNDELKDLLSRGLAAEEIRNIHEVKRTFDGEVKP